MFLFNIIGCAVLLAQAIVIAMGVANSALRLLQSLVNYERQNDKKIARDGSRDGLQIFSLLDIRFLLTTIHTVFSEIFCGIKSTTFR